MMTWNGNHSSHGQRGPASPHQCRSQQVQPCQVCRLPTNARFLHDGICPGCRLAFAKMDVEAWQAAEVTEPTISDDDLDEMWDNYRDHMSL